MKIPDPHKLSASERRAALSMSAIYAVRMLGLFMILPVFAIYASDMDGVTPALIGLAIGIYGFTQALFQVPLGMLSDRIGRKPVIVGGLLIFALGSVLAAMASDIHWIIVGRALQGMGAVASAVMALAADLTREEHRTKVMATIGISIGLAFALAMVMGPLLNEYIGVPGLFWLTALLALLAIAITVLFVPTVSRHFHRDTELMPASLGSVLRDTQLLRLNWGIFSLHMILTANFVAIPLLLSEQLDPARHWMIYLPVFALAFIAMVPFIILAEKYRKMKPVLLMTVMTMILAEGLMLAGMHSLWLMLLGLLVFFTTFNLLEASLPSLVAKLSPTDRKGTAMGVYSSSQFMGIFTGGLAGGWFYGVAGAQGVFLSSMVILVIWALLALSMQQPRYHSSYVLNVGEVATSGATDLAAAIAKVKGVVDVTVIAEEGVAYLKVVSDDLDLEGLYQFSAVPQ
jgi:MFS family permease